MSLPHGAGTILHDPMRDPMSDEREYVTFLDLVRWALPTAIVLLGVVFYFLYANAASAIGGALPTP